ncbi:MAG: hypothetical protein GVY19_01960 [Bacteroidetes bacterium]|jgi:hypothetical protein|nr:hypothetical protein [Bacteroidota bacterium]
MKKIQFTCLAAFVFLATSCVDSHIYAQSYPDSDYVIVRNGHLTLDGERIRFWGYIGTLDPPPFKGKKFSEINDPDEKKAACELAKRKIDLQVQRMVDMGFNLVRYWAGNWGHFSNNYQPGDNSYSDFLAYSLNKMDKHGLKIWWASAAEIGQIQPEDVKIIDDPATAKAWEDAIREIYQLEGKNSKKLGLARGNLAVAWDPRLTELAVRRMELNTQFRNKYKNGLKMADDPQVVVWELINEEWWFSKMIGGKWQELPEFFQEQLLEKWHDYLLDKYENNQNIINAWGFLLPGENLMEKSIMLAPMRNSTKPIIMNDVNPIALESLTGIKQEYSREDFTAQRAADVIEFFMDTWLRYKNIRAEALKNSGKSCRLSPLVWDTGAGFEIQSQYLHQQADAVTMCTYVKGMHHDKNHDRYPFNSGLEELPRLSWDVPWVEHAKSPGKPFFAYETQIGNRTKYRAEYPMRIVSLASVNDWDIINWHDFGEMGDPRDEKPYDGRIEVVNALSLHYGSDEVQVSQMYAAGEAFKNFALKPVQDPTLFIFGKQYLYHPESMDYGGSYGDIGKSMMPTSFAYGCNVYIDTSLSSNPDHPVFDGKEELYQEFIQKGYLVKGKTYKPRVYEPNPIQPTNEIEYNWQKGHLLFDSPKIAAYTGFMAKYGTEIVFDNGTILSDVSIQNPQEMPYPVTGDEKYISFILTSKDGKKLENTNEAIISLVSTSFNSGYTLDERSDANEFVGPGVTNRGSTPVLVARVGATISNNALNGMQYTFRDWHMKALQSGVIQNGKLVIPAEEPIYIIELKRE